MTRCWDAYLRLRGRNRAPELSRQQMACHWQRTAEAAPADSFSIQSDSMTGWRLPFLYNSRPSRAANAVSGCFEQPEPRVSLCVCPDQWWAHCLLVEDEMRHNAIEILQLNEFTAAVKLLGIAEPYSVYVLTKGGLIATWKISVDDEVPQGASDDDDGYV